MYSFYPFISREAVLRRMRETDIFVMPSIGETLGLVYIEAMSQGCITIGVQGEGIDGIIEDGKNGFLVKPNSLNDLEETLRNVLDAGQEYLINISKNAIETGRAYNATDAAFAYLSKIKSLI